MPKFQGFDHVDARVRDLAAVEDFYDRLMPAIGLTRKAYAHVDSAGTWREPDADHPYNTVEYSEDVDAGEIVRFIGFIEDRDMTPVNTRIAFHLDRQFDGFDARLREIGARNVEFDDDMEAYPAIFSRIRTERNSRSSRGENATAGGPRNTVCGRTGDLSR